MDDCDAKQWSPLQETCENNEFSESHVISVLNIKKKVGYAQSMLKQNSNNGIENSCSICLRYMCINLLIGRKTTVADSEIEDDMISSKIV